MAKKKLVSQKQWKILPETPSREKVIESIPKPTEVWARIGECIRELTLLKRLLRLSQKAAEFERKINIK